MRKIIMGLALVVNFAFIGCSNDDDEQNCATCSIDFLGTAITTEACDNGDGTVSVTVEGQTETLSAEDLDGVSPEEYVRALEEGCPSLQG